MLSGNWIFDNLLVGQKKDYENQWRGKIAECHELGQQNGLKYWGENLKIYFW